MIQRNNYFDNAKFILICIVVLGHFTNLNRHIPFMGGLNNIIYSFHMPVFIFISGYFSRDIEKQRKQEINKILYIYIIFEVLNLVFTKTTSLGRGSYNLFTPTFHNWYILGIFFWRLLVPYFNFYPKKATLIFAFIISIYVGLFDGLNILGLNRIIYFMPFFIIGYYADNFDYYLNKVQKYKAIFSIFLGLFFIIVFTLSATNSTFNDFIAYAYTPGAGSNSSLAIILRVLGFTTSLIISSFVLFLIPRKTTFFTRFGKNTLNVFLLHMFFVFPISAIYKMANLGDDLILLLSIFTSILITFFLSLNFVNTAMKPFVNLENILSLRKPKQH
jgi:fucose 4-O-acetylase-like acetyltransferase